MTKADIIKEYERKEPPLYTEFSTTVKNILEIFIKESGLKFQVFNRAKDKNSLSIKIDQKLKEGKVYTKLDDIEDLAGVRIVFYLESDKKRFIKLFIQEFRDCIVDHQTQYNPKGYRGDHFIFRFDESRSNSIEYRKFKNLKCEIQVSTVLFHAWSEVEHDIIYKPEGDEQLLKSLGLDDLKESFEELMAKHITAATFQLDYLNLKYKSIIKAGRILSSDFLKDIETSESNDEIYELLSVVGDFYYKKPEEILAISSLVISKKPIASRIIYRFDDGDLYGKSHIDILEKSIEMLSSIRYFRPNEALNLLAQLSTHEDLKIREKALSVVKKFAQYDYSVLTKSKLGYQPQRMILDFILAWSPEKSIQHFDFVEIAIKELLSSSVEGTEMNDEKTLTIRFAAVDPTDYLKKIRRDTIDFVCNLYEKTSELQVKLRQVKILEEVTSTPHNVKYGDNITEMIREDLEYLVVKYQKIIFGDTKDKIVANLGVAKEIEDRLYWVNKWGENRIKSSVVLRDKILSDESYNLLRLLVGNAIIEQEDDWKVAEKSRNEKLDSLMAAIDDSNYGDWSSKLDKITSQNKTISDWEFGPLRIFLQRLAKLKPDIAVRILELSYQNSSSLRYFIGAFLNGFRLGKHFTQWDWCVAKIVEEKDAPSVKAIVYSLHLPDNADLAHLRYEDTKILSDIVKRDNNFTFLDPEERELHHALINTLSRDYECNPELFEQLIFDELKNNPKYSDLFLSQMSFILWKKWIDIEKLKKGTISFFIDEMIVAHDLDWHMQGLLLAIGKHKGLEVVMDVFQKRIIRDIKRKEKKSKLSADTRFDAIPYHFNPELQNFIAEHPDYPKVAGEWVSKMTIDWSIYNWNVGEFLQRIGKNFNDIVMQLINKGDDDSLMKAARALYSIYGADFGVCMEIVRKTSNKDILSQIRSCMYGTGVVGGEHGIAKAYKAKAESLEKYKDDQNERVRRFAREMIKDFQESATREFNRADDEGQKRKTEFEG